jgi:hypothetical protein
MAAALLPKFVVSQDPNDKSIARNQWLEKDSPIPVHTG